jgi:hypothetical protein
MPDDVAAWFAAAGDREQELRRVDALMPYRPRSARTTAATALLPDAPAATACGRNGYSAAPAVDRAARSRSSITSSSSVGRKST